MNSSYISPFAKPVYIMLKPVGSVCNLACEYCYYLEKSKFYPDVKNHIMTDQILEKFIKEYMECQTMQEVLFTWHGGETLMRPSLSSPPPVAPEPMGPTRARLLNRTLFFPTYMGSKRWGYFSL